MWLPAFSQHGAIRRGAFRHGAHGNPRLRCHESVMSQSCVSVCYVEKTLLLCRISRTNISASLGPQKWAREVTKTLISLASRPIFFNDRATDARQHIAKTKVTNVSNKNTMFCYVHFPFRKKHIFARKPSSPRLIPTNREV